jgi:hypothetical protein
MPQNVLEGVNPKGHEIKTHSPPGSAWLTIQDDTDHVVKGTQLQDLLASGGASPKPISFTPTLSFSTPGNAVFGAGTRSGWLTRVGSLVFININVGFTVTYTTASGYLTIGGNPIPGNNQLGYYWQAVVQTNYVLFPAGTFLDAIINADGTVNLQIVDTAGGNYVGAAHIPSGPAAVWIAVTGVYPAA